MASTSSPTKSILIIGGGTFGTSTAYYLSLKPNQTITVLDRFPPPSIEAAGNDMNKVVRSDYSEPLYSSLGSEAMSVWKDPKSFFNKYFNGTGWLVGAANVSIPFIESSMANSKKLGVKSEWMSPAEIKRKWPAYTGKMPNWKVMWNSAAGWVNAGGALKEMALAAISNGVNYISGDSGFVTQLLFDGHGKCLGAKSKDGSVYFADVVILAAGAAAAGLLDMKGQLVAKGHTVGHLQLTPEEAKHYKDIPIFDHLEQGMIFPPNPDGIMKFAAVEFFTNKSNALVPGVSLPRYRSDNPIDDVPSFYSSKIRNLLRGIIPELADRSWFWTRICWDADTPDLHFLISSHPAHPSLYLAVGGSAHGFKFLPIIGKYISEMIDGTLAPEIAKKWKWRPGVTNVHSGPEPHPLGEPRDLGEFEGWGEEKIKARL